MSRLISAVLGIDPRRALIGLGLVAAVALVLASHGCARESGRAAEANETRIETAETVEKLEETYEQIDEIRAGDSDDAVVERLRDGSFLAGSPAGQAPVSTD